MNVFAKRALILTVLVLCLFGLTIFGVSAATGAAESGENSVASAVVGGTTLYYDDLATALAEADTGSTVTVLKDVALASTVVIDRADATLTLDLGGKTVTTADGVSLAIRLTAGTLTIKNGTLAATSDAIYMGTKALEADPTVVLTLASDLTVTSVTDCCVVIYAGTLNTAATLTTSSEGYSALQGSGNNNDTVINITGGAITANDVALYHPQNGTLNISGGTITGETGVYVKAGTVNITGGKIVATGTVAEAYDENNDGCPSTGDALVVENPGDGYGGVAPVVSVTGGEFSSVAGANVATYAAAEKTAVTDIVSGGTFNKALSEDVCAEGFVVEDLDGDGNFVANPANAVAYIGEVGYATLADAVAAAKDGDIIKLVANVTTGTITVNKSITIEGQIGSDDSFPTIKYTANKAFSITSACTFTLQNVIVTYENADTAASNLIHSSAAGNIVIILNNVTVAANAEKAASGMIYATAGDLTVTLTNCVLSGGSAAFRHNGVGTYTVTTSGCDLGTMPLINTLSTAGTHFASDAEALAAGKTVRIGAVGDDALYYFNLKYAINNAAANDTIYVLASHTLAATCGFSATITIEGVNLGTASEPVYPIITHTAHAFTPSGTASLTVKNLTLKSGGTARVLNAPYEENEAGVVPGNVTFEGVTINGASTDYMFNLRGNAPCKITFKNCTVTTAASANKKTIFYVHGTHPRAFEVVVENSSFSAIGYLVNMASSAASFTFTNTTFSDVVTIGYTAGSSNATVTLNNCTVSSTAGSQFNPISTSTLTLNVNGGSFDMRTASDGHSNSIIYVNDNNDFKPVINVNFNQTGTAKTTIITQGRKTASGYSAPFTTSGNPTVTYKLNNLEVTDTRGTSPFIQAQYTAVATVTATNLTVNTPGTVFQIANTASFTSISVKDSDITAKALTNANASVVTLNNVAFSSALQAFVNGAVAYVDGGYYTDAATAAAVAAEKSLVLTNLSVNGSTFAYYAATAPASLDDAAAEIGAVLRIGAAGADAKYFYNIADALAAAQNNNTIWVIDDYTCTSNEVTVDKTVIIEGVNKDVVFTSIDNIPFKFYTCDITFKNIKIDLNNTRLGRIDGSANITFGDNCHITVVGGDGHHFLYTNDTMQSGVTVKTYTITLAETASFARPTGGGYFMQSSTPAAKIGDASAIHIHGTFNVVESTNSGNIFRDAAKGTANNNGGNPNVSVHIYSTAKILATKGGHTYFTGLTYYHDMTVDQAVAIADMGKHHLIATDGTNLFSIYLYDEICETTIFSKAANNSTVYVRSFNNKQFVITGKALTFRGYSADGSVPTIAGYVDQFMLGKDATVTLENMVYTYTGRAFRFGDNNADTSDENTKFILGDKLTIKLTSWGTEDLFHAGGAVSSTLEMKATATIDITANDANGVHRVFNMPAVGTVDLRGTIKINWTTTNAASYLMGVTTFAGTINIYDTSVIDITISGGQTDIAEAKCHHFFRNTSQDQKINVYGGTITWTGPGTPFLSNTANGNLTVTGGTFTHNGDGSGTDNPVNSIFYRYGGGEAIYNISGATLIAKGNAYIFEQGWGIGMVKNTTISSERAEIVHTEGSYGVFVNVKVAPAADADRFVVAAGIPFAGRLAYENDGVLDGVIYAGNGSGFDFGLALSAIGAAGLEGPVYLMGDMEVATSINLKGGSLNLAGANLGTVDAPVYPTITAAVDLFTLSAGDNVTLTNLNLVLAGNRAFYIPEAMASAADITLNNLNVTGSANLVASANVVMSFNLTIEGGRYVLTSSTDAKEMGFLFNDANAAEKETVSITISDAYLKCGVARSRNTEVLNASLDNVTIDLSNKGIFMPYGSGTWTIEINGSNISTEANSLVYNPDTTLVILNAYDSEFTITAPTSLYGSFYYGTAETAHAAKLQSTMNNVKITVGGSSASVIYTNSTVAEIDLDWTNVTATSTYRILDILNAGTKVKHHFKLTGCNFVATSYVINVQYKGGAGTKDNVFVEIYDSYMQSKIEVLRFTDEVGAYFKCVDSTFKCTGTMCVASNTNGMPYMDFYNCKIYGGGTNYAVRLYGKKGSYANFYDTYIYGNNTTNAPLAGGNAIVYNFYSGWIDTKASQGAFNALSADVEINFYGGTVNVLPSTGAAVAYTTSTGKVNVYGGQFYSNNTASALFYNASPTKELVVGAYVAQGLSELCVNAGTGLPSAAFDKNGVSTFNAPRMTAGATPVVTANGVGLGFLGTVPAAVKAYLESLADVVTPAVEDPENPDNNTPAVYAISYGMLIVNYEAIKNDPEALRYLTHYGMKAYFGESEIPCIIDLNAETVAAMQAEGIDVDFEIVNEDDGCVSVKATLPAGLSEKYGAIVYACYEVDDGAPAYSYSAFSVAENVRNLEQVLRSAYNDLSATQTEFYANEVTVGEATMYSHFTADERAAMAEMLGADTDRKVLDLYIMAGGSNTIGHAPFGADFADDFYASTDLDNVFVSGTMAQNAQLNLGSGAVKDIIAAKYISAGTAAGLGLGWSSDVLGFEAGLASALAKQYNDETGKYAAIFKYGFADLAIADLTADGSAIYALFIAALMENVAMYEEQGFDVNIVGLYWAQGEADASEDDVLTTYPAQFNTLVADLKADLAVAELPVTVAELSIYTAAGTTIADNEAFVEMQNTLENVTIVEIAELLTDNGLYFDPTEVILAGEIAASILYNTTVEEADQVEVPKADPMMQILDADGQPFLNEDGEPVGYRSLAIAIAKLPEGCSIQLTSDITLYAALNVINANGAVVDGNGKTITIKASSGSGMVFESSKIELQNLNVVHTGTAAGTYAIEVGGRSRVTISGNSNLTAEKTVIRMDGVGSTLILKDATVTSRNEDCAATDALIYTTNSNLMVDGGTLNAAGNAACIYIDAAAPEKLAVNIKAGTFNSNATCFINKSIVAIMVAAPGVTVNAPVAFENAGFGNK